LSSFRASLQSATYFLLYSSIFISLCAVALCIETNLLLGIPLQNWGFYVFVACSTLLQYNLHYFIKTKKTPSDPRTHWSCNHTTTHKVLIVLGLAGVIAGLFSFSFQHLIVVGILGALTVLYSFPFLPFPVKKRLKDFGLLKITVLTLTWTIITVWLPVAESGWDLSIWLIFIRRFLFMGALCLAFDIRDAYYDGQAGIGTIPVAIGLKKSYRIIYVLLALFIAVSIYQLCTDGNIYIFNAMMLSATATFILTEKSKSDRSDLLYLGGIDGMMLLQAILVAAGT
jgi:4-hydroxybenzoate polyprenyltransferase